MKIIELFEKGETERFSTELQSQIAIELNMPPDIAKSALLAVELCVLLTRICLELEDSLKKNVTPQALAHKYVDSWALIIGLPDLVSKLHESQDQYRLQLLLEQGRRASLSLLDLISLVGQAKQAELVCNLLIELNKSVERQSPLLEQLVKQYGS